MRLIGAGLPRTGTTSLKHALQLLTGGRCYHMLEVFGFPDHPRQWSKILDGDAEPVDKVFEDFDCAVDWPTSGAWRLLAEHYPDTPVLLSHRADADTWWRSADATVWESMRRFTTSPPEGAEDWLAMSMKLIEGFDSNWDDETAAKAAYERHLAEVRAAIPAERLFEYQPGDGWGPICKALGVPEPDEPFPHRNTTADFRAHNKWD